jgi:hypothetical protein
VFGALVMGPYLGASGCGRNSLEGPVGSLRCYSDPTGAMRLDQQMA